MASLFDEFLLPVRPPTTSGAAEPTILEALGVSSRNVESFVGSGDKVGDSSDLHRILELPRRPRPTEEELEDWRIGFDRLNKHPTTCLCQSKYRRKCPERLLDTQAWALREIEGQQGLLGPIPVGEGKTLLDLLAPMVIPDCKVAVLLIGPQLRNQLTAVDWDFYGQHWHLPNLGSGAWFEKGKPTLHIVAYSELSSAKNSDVLERIRPDLVIADEAQMLRNANAARTKRFRRYFSAHPETRFLAWSGTLASRSIKDYAHLSNLALKEGSPTPLHWPTVEEWAGAIDPSDWPSAIGKLAAFCEPGENVRDGFRRRVLDTPGVVSAPERGACSAELTFIERKVQTPPVIDEYLAALNASWTRPDGEELITALDVARCRRELSAGLFYRWRFPRNEPLEVRDRWFEVRARWHKEMREKLKQSKEFLDSPLLLVKAAIRWHDGYDHINHETGQREHLPPHTKNGPMPTWASEVWPEWREVRDTVEPESEGVWIDDFLARDAADWLKKNIGICWYEHDIFGHRVAELSGAKLYGAGKAAHEGIAHEDGSSSIVASVRSHGTGKNLQMFNLNLFANPPSAGDAWEQALGRTHRQGQLADEVLVYVYRHTAGYVDALDRAKIDAAFAQGPGIGGEQKLLRCAYTF